MEKEKNTQKKNHPCTHK